MYQVCGDHSSVTNPLLQNCAPLTSTADLEVVKNDCEISPWLDSQTNEVLGWGQINVLLF